MDLIHETFTTTLSLRAAPSFPSISLAGRLRQSVYGSSWSRDRTQLVSQKQYVKKTIKLLFKTGLLGQFRHVELEDEESREREETSTEAVDAQTRTPTTTENPP